MGDMINAYEVLVENMKEKHFKDADVDGDNVSNLTEIGKVWTGLIWLRIGTSDGCL
jgi:hypothetical protein